MISYHVTPSNPAAHLFTVTVTVDQPDPTQAFWLPAWIPGSYMIRNFARHMIGLQAQDSAGNDVPITQIDKQQWAVNGVALNQVTLSYEVYAWDRSVRTAHLDQTHGYFNASSLLLAVKNREQEPCQLTLAPPQGQVDGNWRVATAMPSASAEPWGFGQYRTSNYDELIDHPIEMADFTLGEFEAEGVTHHIVLSGKHRTDLPRLESDLQKICAHHIRFWGVPAPMSDYLFMTMVVGEGYGGLEHRASTSLMAKRDDLPKRGMDKPTAGYLNYLGLCSHEYFHTWNVKRLKPRAFLPYDLTQESYTELLWWFEGVTSYYDDLGVLRAGCASAEQYLDTLSQTMTRVHRGQGRFKQSIADSSFNAWTKFYLQDENAPNAIVSYYTKGSLFALMLDLTIRLRTDHAQSLDDLVRAVWGSFHATGVPERGIPSLAAEVIDCDLSDVFALGVEGTADLPLDELLAQFGVTTTWGTPVALSMPGGKQAFLRPGQISLGAVFDSAPNGARIRAVLADSPAQR
ncbi:MAG: peptidase M61, partial [Natronospirillum sp.]